ncbi:MULTISPECIES: hypothetical protein [Tenacibaculum]|uniref:hypothetical protein n=1 Tax=Tenacibaculum TaxID=104267 RepID=UPI001F0A5F1B|nr:MULTISPECIES: hypothetical protein [Tenacibaculum]MCH3881097.1 hypothetical protein [Tenacibaculum aquimarinum]MDO6599303.1 hypothetical protein [Tenacibaculum sp. 1_MG-2023]
MKALLKLYRILSYLILLFFIVGFGLSIREYVTGKTLFDSFQLIFNILWIYLFLSVLYFHRKTKEMNDLKRFKFDILSVVTNLTVGFLFLGFSLFVLFVYPINPIDLEEVLRLLLLALVGFYGFLKINYSIFVYKKINNGI